MFSRFRFKAVEMHLHEEMMEKKAKGRGMLGFGRYFLAVTVLTLCFV